MKSMNDAACEITPVNDSVIDMRMGFVSLLHGRPPMMGDRERQFV
jgi:hypothetical protein